MAVMCFFSFLTSVFWGEFSNHLGRVKVFTISCVCYGLAQLSLGFSSSELMVLISRGAAGAFSGGAIVATMAYVIDVSEPAKQASNLAVYTAMQSASLAVGYLLGGVLGTIHFQLAFNVQAVWMIVLGVGAMFFVEDSIVDPADCSSARAAENRQSVQLLCQRPQSDEHRHDPVSDRRLSDRLRQQLP